MPTTGLKVQGDGFWRGWLNLFGGTTAAEVVDDSDGTSHDSAATYLSMRLLNLAQGNGRISFPVFRQADGIIPTSISVNVVARRGTVSHPDLEIGLTYAQPAVAVFDPMLFTTDANWTLATRTFSSNPWSGAPWALADLAGLELCVSSEPSFFGPGTNEITLVSGTINYDEPHNYGPRDLSGRSLL